MNVFSHRPVRLLCNVLMMYGLLAIISPIIEAQELQSKKGSDVSVKDIEWITSTLKAQKKHDGLTTLESADVEKFEALLVKTLKEKETLKTDSSLAGFKTQWAELDWQLKRSPSSDFFSISESTGHRNGRGVYAFRTNVDAGVVLQAPHRFNDLMTGTISTKLFCEQSISAIAINTVHRKEIDLSHTELHYINAFTSAVLKAQPGVAILQMHGFTKKGKTGAAKFTKAIISDTTNFPGRSARQTALELKTTFGEDHTRLFPVDVRQLGGTTNRQSQIAHDLGCPDFLHIELNHEFRTQLKSNASVRASFYASILRGIAK